MHELGAWCLSSAEKIVFMVTCNKKINARTGNEDNRPSNLTLNGGDEIGDGEERARRGRPVP